jgi:hypothetical protein
MAEKVDGGADVLVGVDAVDDDDVVDDDDDAVLEDVEEVDASREGSTDGAY